MLPTCIWSAFGTWGSSVVSSYVHTHTHVYNFRVSHTIHTGQFVVYFFFFVERFLYACLHLPSVSTLFFHVFCEPCLTFSYFLCHHTAHVLCCLPVFFFFFSFVPRLISASHVLSSFSLLWLPVSALAFCTSVSLSPTAFCTEAPALSLFLLPHYLFPCERRAPPPDFCRGSPSWSVPLLDEWPFSALTSCFPPPDSSDCVLTSLPQPFLIF